jgi:hypothetical protein
MPQANEVRTIPANQVGAMVVHSLANMIPAMPESSIVQLTQSMVANGQLTPVTMFEGRVLDGRHRLIAAQRAGLPLNIVNFEGTAREAMLVAVQQNVARRQLTVSQRAVAAAKAVTSTVGGTQAAGTVTQSQAADMFQVSLRYVTLAQSVLARCDAATEAALWAGETTLNAANLAMRPARTATAPTSVTDVLGADVAVAVAVDAGGIIAALLAALRNDNIDAAELVHAMGADAILLVGKFDELNRRVNDIAMEEGALA